MDADRHDAPGLSPAGLAALLDLVERPAVALTPDGQVQGANERFCVLAGRHGAGVVELAQVLAPECLARLLLLAARQRGAPREEFDVVFRDGSRQRGRAETVGHKDGVPLTVLVVESAAAGGGARAAAALRHDIAGPLTAILGTAELMVLRGGDQLARDVRDGLGQILENCGRITEILQKSRAADRAGHIDDM